MTWFTRARFAFCLLLIASIFSNAMGAGMCMLFCTEKVCCDKASENSEKTACPMSPGGACCHLVQTVAAKCVVCSGGSAKLPKPCCDWIAKKNDASGVLKSAMPFSENGPAWVPPKQFFLDPSKVWTVRAYRPIRNDRGPPLFWFECSPPRGPPIA